MGPSTFLSLLLPCAPNSRNNNTQRRLREQKVALSAELKVALSEGGALLVQLLVSYPAQCHADAAMAEPDVQGGRGRHV